LLGPPPTAHRPLKPARLPLSPFFQEAGLNISPIRRLITPESGEQRVARRATLILLWTYVSLRTTIDINICYQHNNLIDLFLFAVESIYLHIFTYIHIYHRTFLHNCLQLLSLDPYYLPPSIGFAPYDTYVWQEQEPSACAFLLSTHSAQQALHKMAANMNNLTTLIKR
jgi:hypothetical protein